MDLRHSTCVITGVSGTTGSTIRTLLLDQGATVIGTLRPDKHPGELVDLSHGAFMIELNPLDPDSVSAAVNTIHNELGQIHGWINVVGGFDMGMVIEDYPRSDWDYMWNLNFLSVLNVTQAILPHFKKYRSGRLINFGSAAALKGMAHAGPYLVSKAAVHSLTQATAAELVDDLTCNAILPAIIDTAANRSAMPDADFSSWVTPQAIALRITELLENSTNGALIIL